MAESNSQIYYLRYDYKFIAINYPWFSFECRVEVCEPTVESRVEYTKKGREEVKKTYDMHCEYIFYGLYNDKTDRFKIKDDWKKYGFYEEKEVDKNLDEIRRAIKELEGEDEKS